MEIKLLLGNSGYHIVDLELMHYSIKFELQSSWAKIMHYDTTVTPEVYNYLQKIKPLLILKYGNESITTYYIQQMYNRIDNRKMTWLQKLKRYFGYEN